MLITFGETISLNGAQLAGYQAGAEPDESPRRLPVRLADRGCWASSSCLECSLPACIWDLSSLERRAFVAARRANLPRAGRRWDR
jgi:hypothetical protein